jgi:CubicO group peptidase (beta-lactamase class C family)
MKSRLSTMFVLVLVSGSWADPSESERIADLENGLRPPVTIRGDQGWNIRDRMEHYGVPGAGVAVIHDYGVVWFKTYGLADRETGEPVKPTTLFQAGSISKPVAAFGALQMVAAGRLTLDGNVNDVLTTWKLPDNEFTADQKVTLTQLLSHTGGLTVHGFPGYAVGEPVPTLIQVLDGSAPANTPAIRVDKTPREGWRYSGGGYTIAQQMMIDAAGKPFPKLLDELVIAPLGMTHSTFQQPLPPDLLRHAAAGVLPDKSAVEGKRHTYPEMAAAGLWTTAEDLAIFAVEVQRALQGKGKLMSPQMAEKMVEPVVDHFGRGWGLSRRGDARYLRHNGWDEGFCAALVAHQDAGYGAAVMINSNHPDFMNEVVRAVAYAYEWGGYEAYEKMAVPEVALRKYTGRYRYNAELAFSIYREGDRLFLRYVGSAPEEMLYVGEGRFVRRERSAPITFTDGQGGVQLGFVQSDGGLQTHPRLAENDKLPRELLAEGHYAAALAAYRAVLTENPEESAVSESYLNGRGLSYLDENVEHAIAILRIATDLYPESANTWDSLGSAYRQAGNTKRAIEYYRMALERDPEFPSAKKALAELEGGSKSARAR